jgi:hypothetical protein
MRDVGYRESPREIPAEAQIEAERQPSVGVDGSAVSYTQVVVDLFPTLQDEPVGVHTQIGACVKQELPFSQSVTKRRPVVVVQACAATDVRCVSYAVGGRQRAGYIFAPCHRNGGGTSRC